jgi:hypothetical protein
LSKYSKRKKKQAQEPGGVQPWISMKSGRRVILVLSIALAVWTAVQVIPQRGVLEGAGWGLLFGGLIWVIFEGYTLLHRYLRRLR